MDSESNESGSRKTSHDITDKEKSLSEGLNENKIKALQFMISDKVAKDKMRTLYRTKNLKKGKEYELMNFEKVKFEIIQKVTKKFQKITEENKDDILSDVEKYNLQKVIDEVIKNIVDSKFDFKDVNAIIIVLSRLNQIYENFSQKYSEYLKKQMSDLQEQIKIPSKNEDEEEKRSTRRKTFYRLFIESYTYGLINDFKAVHECFLNLISKKDLFNQNFPIIVNLMKVFADVIFGILPKTIKKLLESGTLKDYNINILLGKDQCEKYVKSFTDYFNKVVVVMLEEEHKILVELEKKNNENLKRLDSNQEVQQSYNKQRTSFIRLMSNINDFAETMDFEVPSLADEKAFRYEESKKNEIKLEKLNQYDPFSDEQEYQFYMNHLDLKIHVPLQLLEKKASNKDKDKLDAAALEEKQKKKEEKLKNYEAIVQKIIKVDSKEQLDEIIIDFLNKANSVKNRKAMVRCMLRGSRTNYAILKYFARFAAHIGLYFKDFTQELSQALIDEYNILQKDDKLTNIDERMRNIRFICELIKFEIYPMNQFLEILKRLVDDLKGTSIDLICSIMDNCGRFLYVNESTHVKFNACMESIRQIATQKLKYDERSFNSIINSLYVCKPTDTLKRKVKVRPVEEEYIRYLINVSLDKDTVKHVAVLLRRMNWNEWGNVIQNTLYKYISKGKEIQLNYVCCLLKILKETHPQLIINIVNITLEEIRTGLEKNDYTQSQNKILLCNFVGKLYSYTLINSDLVFSVLYMILMYHPDWNWGRREFILDNPLDKPSDSFRILMVINILDTCGVYFTEANKKEKLLELIHFLQIYILTKKSLGIDVENRIISTFENLIPKLNIYNDFTSALKDIRNFSGFNFDYETLFPEDSLTTSDVGKTSEEDKNNASAKQESNNYNDDADFKRDQVKDTYKVINVDDEIQRIVNESLSKAKGAAKPNSYINPINDVKKISKPKAPNKIKLIVKQANKPIVKEIDKTGRLQEDEDV